MTSSIIEEISQIVGRTGVLRICHKSRLEKTHLLQAIGEAVVGCRRRRLGIRDLSCSAVAPSLMEVAYRIKQYRNRTILGFQVDVPKDLDCLCEKTSARMVDCQIQKQLIV